MWNRVAQLGCISHQSHRILARSILGSGLLRRRREHQRSCGHALQLIMALLRTYRECIELYTLPRYSHPGAYKSKVTESRPGMPCVTVFVYILKSLPSGKS